MKKQFSLVFLIWLGASLLGALPFYFSGFFPDFASALFESVSGFTTTGATVLADIEALPAPLLLWRAATQWLGGIGILFTITMFPIFNLEDFQSRKKEKDTFSVIMRLYIALTALQFALLVIFGINRFDALTLSFSTISTGGFSIRNSGLAYYNSAAAEWICAGFMFFAGMNLYLFWLFFRGKAKELTRNSEARAYTGIITISVIIITAAILPQSLTFAQSLRRAFFHTVSIISTTGFYTADINFWPSAAQAVLFLLLFIGGCSGSAAGGIKIIRSVLLSKQSWAEMKRIVYPRGVFSIQLNGKSWNKRIVHGIAGFVFLYFFAAFLAALLVSSGGADVFTSINTALLCQGNIGLGIGSPAVFVSFPAYIKLGLCFVMILGRLELWTVLVLFSGSFWRR